MKFRKIDISDDFVQVPFGIRVDKYRTTDKGIEEIPVIVENIKTIHTYNGLLIPFVLGGESNSRNGYLALTRFAKRFDFNASIVLKTLEDLKIDMVIYDVLVENPNGEKYIETFLLAEKNEMEALIHILHLWFAARNHERQSHTPFIPSAGALVAWITSAKESFYSEFAPIQVDESHHDASNC